jgi:iron complex outermembrane receptor protein
VSFEHRFSESFGYSLAYHGLISDRTFKDGPQGVSFEPSRETLSEFDGRIHTFYALADFELGSWNFVTAGYELESETFINSSFPANPTENASVDVTQSSNTFYIQDQLSFLEGSLQISGAFRAQFFSLDDPIFSPVENAPYAGVQVEDPPRALTGDGSVAYFFRSSGTKLRAHVGNAYRAPSLFERFGTFFSTFGYSVFGDPRLKPERSLGYDIGVDQAFLRQRVSLSATFFDTRLKQVIIFDFTGAIDPATDPFGRFGGYRRVDGGSARGLELSSAATPAESLHFAVAYTYTDTEPPAGGDEALMQAFVIPKHQFSLVATQYLARDLFVNFELTVSDGYFAPVFDPVTFVSRTYRFGGIVKADLGASYTWPLAGAKGVRLFGKVENLFDRENFESGFRTPGRTAVAGAAFQF